MLVIEHLYTTSDVARMFRVTPATVRRWGRQGRLGVEIRTPGNHRRFQAGHIDKLMGEFHEGQDSRYIPPRG